MKKKLMLGVAVVIIIAKSGFCSNFKIIELIKPDTSSTIISGNSDTVINYKLAPFEPGALCGFIRQLATNELPEHFKVMTSMMKQANTYWEDPERNKKLQKFWKDNYSKIICTDGMVDEAFGGLLRTAVQFHFLGWLSDISGFKSEYNFDINVKDPVDGLTIADWCIMYFNDEDNGKSENERVKKIYDFLVERGAKTTKQLNEAGGK